MTESNSFIETGVAIGYCVACQGILLVHFELVGTGEAGTGANTDISGSYQKLRAEYGGSMQHRVRHL